MKIYEVVTKFYNNGRVKAVINELEIDTIPENKCTETANYDMYQDYFKSKKLAYQFYKDSLKA